MIKRMPYFTVVGAATVGLILAVMTARSHAQQAKQLASAAKADAALVVEGIVRQVFRSPRQSRTDYLLEIDVQRSEARRLPPGIARPQFPSPGECVYVPAGSPRATSVGGFDGTARAAVEPPDSFPRARQGAAGRGRAADPLRGRILGPGQD
jgi:hypothetical protein